MPAPGTNRHDGRANLLKGRKGLKNKKTLARMDVAEKALSEGVSPLAVMLANMRFAHEKAEFLTRTLEAQSRDSTVKPAAKVTTFKEMMRFRQMSQDAARDSAPFVHARLTSISVKPPEPEGGRRIVVEGGLPRRASDSTKPTEDEIRGIIEGTAVDITPRGADEK